MPDRAPQTLDPTHALVVLSGGQDSTTCLYWAKRHYGKVSTITFDYGQRHRREIDSALKIAELAEVENEVIDISDGVLIGSSPLVSGNPVGHYDSSQDMPGGIEPTFVPARNLLFLTIAGNRAHALRAGVIVTGVSQEDFGGYPDCREQFISAMRLALSQGIIGDDDSIEIQTPLIHLDKKATVSLAAALPGCMEALAFSHTCYDGEYPPNPRNHASILRAKGFRDAGVADPLILRAKAEGALPTHYPNHGFVVDN